jgi:hypothetical protein
MPRRKKHPRELTDEKALRRLFPTEVRKEARKEARKARKRVEEKENAPPE